MIPRLSAVTWARWLCGTAALAIIILLLVSKKPWDILASIGTPTKPQHFAAIYEWWAGLANAILFAGLALTAKWWLRPSPPPATPWLAPVPTPRWFWPLVLVAMAFTAFCGAQRLSHSLWDDEEKSLRSVILGEYRPDQNGRLKLREVKWETSLWNYKVPTNHHLQTLLSKASLSIWRAVTQPHGLQFSEPAVRFPSYLAGVLSLGALALLVKRLGFPRAAVVAAFLLALHPWHVRYAAEARGYIFTLLSAPLLLYFLLQAVENGRWRWWAAFGAAAFFTLYAYPGCLYLVVIANLAGLAAIFARNGFSPVALRQISRFLVVNIVAAMVYLQLMLPCIPQVMAYFQSDRALGVLSPRWHRNFGSHFLAGIPWNNSDNPVSGYPELQWTAAAHPVLFPILTALVLLLLLLGMARLVWARPRAVGWLMLPVLLLPGALIYLLARTKGQYLYEWYVLFALPGLVALAALGLDLAACAVARWHRLAAPILLILGVGTFALTTQPQRSRLLSHSLQPMRESVLLTRSTLDPYDPGQKEILTAGLNAFPAVYDINVIGLDSPQKLLDLAREADATGKPLFINYGNQIAAIVDSPRLVAMVEDDRFFEKSATLPGFDPSLTRFVRRYKPGSLAGTSPAP